VTANQEIALSILGAVVVLGMLTLAAGSLMIGMAWRDFQQQVGASASPTVFIGRALARKCPVCGRGAIARSLLRMNQSCYYCGAVFWSNEGEWIGPVVINYSAAMGAALATWAFLMLFNFSLLAQIALPSLIAIGAALLVMPWSRSFWTLFLYLTGEIGRQEP
jgi:uncharacterized protein (DUF983 family)